MRLIKPAVQNTSKVRLPLTLEAEVLGGAADSLLTCQAVSLHYSSWPILFVVGKQVKKSLRQSLLLRICMNNTSVYSGRSTVTKSSKSWKGSSRATVGHSREPYCFLWDAGHATGSSGGELNVHGNRRSRATRAKMVSTAMKSGADVSADRTGAALRCTAVWVFALLKLDNERIFL